MKEDILNLPIGSALQLQRISPDNQDRYSVSLIGYLPYKSLVVTTPLIGDKTILANEGQRFAVRILQGSHIVGFVATILHATSVPYPHLHLSFPEEVESIAVRNAERISTNLHGLIRNSRHPDLPKHWQPILLKDLSLTGAKVESIEPLGRKEESLEVHFSLPVLGASEKIQLQAVIKNKMLVGDRLDLDETRYSCGVSFEKLDRMQEVLISSYVLENQRD